VLPEAFLVVDEILLTAGKVIKGLTFNEAQIQRNLETYAPFAATEAIIIEAVKRGADRQAMHELLRGVAMEAWRNVAEGGDMSMADLLHENKQLAKYVARARLDELLDVTHHVGDAPARARRLAAEIKRELRV
jgi:adenylosuccinate lyase